MRYGNEAKPFMMNTNKEITRQFMLTGFVSKGEMGYGFHMYYTISYCLKQLNHYNVGIECTYVIAYYIHERMVKAQ